jgi:hypothetical protein
MKPKIVTAFPQLALLLALSAAPAPGRGIEIYWTVDATPPASIGKIDDFHLKMQIVKVPFSFGGTVITDDDDFASSGATVPDPGGNFTIDFSGASPAFSSTNPLHVEFNMRSTEDVKIVGWTWTLGGIPVQNVPPHELEVGRTVIPEPSSLALAALALAVGGFTVKRGRIESKAAYCRSSG